MPQSQPLRAWIGYLNHKGGHVIGDFPPKPVWHRREVSRSPTSSFWRGRAFAGITHRPGKRNM
eukprot:13791108-Ditylum_brightwellii.AAC.1